MTREEAIKILEHYAEYWKKVSDEEAFPIDDDIEALQMAIEALQERKTGKWINCKYPLGECSICHKIINIQANEAVYCPCCGSRITGYEEYE